MTQREFEERTGMTVTAEEYSRIENFYLLDGRLSKDAFCEGYRKEGEKYLSGIALKVAREALLQAVASGEKAQRLSRTLKAIMMSIPLDALLDK